MRNYPKTAQEWLDDNETRLAHLHDVADRFKMATEAIVGHATSRDGGVDVSVNAAGEVVTLRIADAALRVGAERLAESIVSTMRDAQRSCAQSVRNAVAEFDTGASIEVLEALGFAEASSPPRSQSQPVTTEDDWGDTSFLSRA